MYRVDGILEPPKELLWEGTIVYGDVTCSFAKSASPITITCEMEEEFRIQQIDTELRIS
jgi:hypothetical protein